MVINNLKVNGYKNLDGVDISLDPKMNVICGENAQGKTNLIEAVWLCSGCRSFRGTRDKDFINFDKDSASVEMKFSDSVRTQEICFSVKKGALKDKLVTLNGVKLPLLSRLFGSFRCVVFTPEDLNLTKGSPDNRRSFTDLSIAQVKPSYINALNKYNTVLSHRNALLKKFEADVRGVLGTNEAWDQLDIWNYQLAESGAYISVLRNTFCAVLNGKAGKLYSSITDGREGLELKYQSTVYEDLTGETDFKGRLAEEYRRRLEESLEADKRAGFTTVGVHRDDLGAFINGLPIREFGSQGQARSAALSMKLAHAQIIRDEYGEYPVMLLDDVLSELDPMRQRFILNNIDDMQVIITCCDSRTVTDMREGRVFTLKKGRIER